MDKIRESVERVEEEEMGRAPLQRVSVAQGDQRQLEGAEPISQLEVS